MEGSNDHYSAMTSKEVFSLTKLGINEQFIRSNHITMESEKYICIRETSPQNRVVIIDMINPTEPNLTRLNKAADSALMNPQDPILAFKVKVEIEGRRMDQLHICDVDSNAELKFHVMAEVVFWKWITPKVLGLVTQTTVYHWSTEGSSEPIKMFDRSSNLQTSGIISYQCDPSQKWFALIGTWRDPLFSGKMQVFSVQEQNSREYDALVANFTTFKVEENDALSTLICFATGFVSSGKEKYRIQLNVIELGAQPGKPGFAEKSGEFRIGDWPGFPLALQISEKYGLVSVITKRGLVSVHLLETAASIFSYNMSEHYMILTTEAKTRGGFYSINEGGQVILTDFNDGTIDKKSALKDGEIAQECLRALLATKEKLRDLQKLREEMLNTIEEFKKQSAELQKEKEEIVNSSVDSHEKDEQLKDEIAVLKSQKIELQTERDNIMRKLDEFRLSEGFSTSNHRLEANLQDINPEDLNRITKNFDKSLEIGKGGYGPVYKAFLGLKPVAIKIPIPEQVNDQVTRQFQEETEILSGLRHPNIVMLLGTCRNLHAIVYELMPNGNLYDILRNQEGSNVLTWKERIRIASNICSALIYLHSFGTHGIAHGDLKSTNILLDSNYIGKLSDFGVSRHLEKTDLRTTAHHYTEFAKGTIPYIEQDYLDRGDMTAQTDVYAFGIVLLELVTGRKPMGLRKDALANGDIFDNHSSGGWPLEEAKKMVRLGLRCSEYERKNRPSLENEVRAEIESMWHASLRF